MVISPKQIEVFHEKMFQDIIQQILSEFDLLKPENNIQTNWGKKEAKDIIEVGRQWGLLLFSEYKYFLYLCFKYSLSRKDLDSNPEILDAFTYPDRSNEDKLFNFHYYLKNTQNGLG